MEHNRIYISTPLSYMPEGEKAFAMMKNMAEYYGFEVVNRFFAIAPNGKCEPIGRDHLDNCDIVIGDVNLFRGGEPESGVAFEMGIGFAKGKRLYSFSRDFRKVVHRYPVAHFGKDGQLMDEHGFYYATGDTPGNLMYAVPSKMVEGGFEDCLKVLRIDRIEEAKDRGQRVVPRKDLRGEVTWSAEGVHRAYLAGFECFMVNSREVGDAMKEICTQYGLEGIFPPDDAPGVPCPDDEAMSNRYTAMAYYFDRDQQHIRNSNMVIANLNPFHGHEPDSGTVFETGMSYGLGYDCYGFMGDGRPMRERIPCRETAGLWLDIENYTVEDYGFPLGHKLAGCVKLVVGDFEDAVQFVAKDRGIVAK